MPDDTNIKTVVKTHFTTDAAVNMWESVYTGHGDFFSYAMTARRDAVIEIFLADNPMKWPKVADIGCGAGVISKALISLGYDVTGLDISEGMVANARKIRELKVEVGDIEALPFADGTFDRVVCLGVITYLPNEMKALGELRRILKPDGKLVLAVRNKLEVSALFDVLDWVRHFSRKIFRAFAPKDPANAKPAYYHRNFISWRLNRNLVRAGFSIERRLGCGYDFPLVLGRRITPLKAGIGLSRTMENLSEKSLFSFIRNWGLVYIVVARKSE